MLESLCDCAVRASFDITAEAIILISDSQLICRTLSRYRPMCPIFLVVFNSAKYNSSRMVRGVFPILFEKNEETIDDEYLSQ